MSTSTNMSQKYPMCLASNIHLEIIFEHPKYKTLSIYKVMLDSMATVSELKDDLKYRLRTEPHDQLWYYKGMLISEKSTLKERGVHENDKVLVKVNQIIQ